MNTKITNAEIRVVANGWIVQEGRQGDYGRDRVVSINETHVFSSFEDLCVWLKDNMTEAAVKAEVADRMKLQ